MIIHPSTSVLFVVGDDDSSLQPVLSYLQNMGHIKAVVESRMVSDLSPYDVVVTENTAAFAGDNEQLTKFVHGGGGWLGLVKLSDKPLPQLFGAQPNPLGPEAELRVLFKNKDHPLATRLPEVSYLKGCHQPLDKTTENTETVLYADWRYQHSPVLVHRSAGEGQVACTTLQAYDDPAFQQILYRLLRLLAGHFEPHRTYGVGLLGYAQSVGQPHGLGIEATPGLILRAACDLDKERLRQAQQDFPEVKTYDSADGLAKDPEVNVVIVATPPNTHADLSLQMMAAGKHVVCEKPLALNGNETAAMVEMAEKQRVHLSCHQNRRWDVDYLAIKQALADGLIGDLFYLETFVGGFNHPCGYWHSHDAISGGTTYDWGAHYLDWVVSLMPGPVSSIVSTRQNRVWHDVTNAGCAQAKMVFAWNEGCYCRPLARCDLLRN